LMGERSEDPTTNTEISRTHVRAFLRAFKAECDAAKVGGGHAEVILLRDRSTQASPAGEGAQPRDDAFLFNQASK
jgi:hypothetical protein